MRSSIPKGMVGAGGGAALAVIGVASIVERPRTISSRALFKTGESPSSVTEVGTAPMRAMIGAGSAVFVKNLLTDILNFTELGRVVIALRPDLAPGHVERIKTLARQGFYDGVAFHRVIEGFMAQTGCPHGTGTGGSDLPDLKAEFNAEPHVRGTVSMARTSAPNSANSQFFICFDDATFLDKQYTVWGEVESGMEYVDALPKGEPPADPGKIVKAEIRAAA